MDLILLSRPTVEGLDTEAVLDTDVVSNAPPVKEPLTKREVWFGEEIEPLSSSEPGKKAAFGVPA